MKTERHFVVSVLFENAQVSPDWNVSRDGVFFTYSRAEESRKYPVFCFTSQRTEQKHNRNESKHFVHQN